MISLSVLFILLSILLALRRPNSPRIQLLSQFFPTLYKWYQSSDSATSMVETRSATAMAMTNEAIASLRVTTDHHNKDIQEIHKIQKIHTRTMNEMNQYLIAILQKLGSNEARPQSFQEPLSPIRNSSTMSLVKPIKLDFLHFSSEDPASWVYKSDAGVNITSELHNLRMLVTIPAQQREKT